MKEYRSDGGAWGSAEKQHENGGDERGGGRGESVG